LRPAILDRDGAPLYPAEFAQRLNKSGGPWGPGGCRGRTEVAGGRQPSRLLRTCVPHLGREQQTAASDQSNELTPFYVEHGGLPPLCHGLPHTQPASERRLGPWGKPELF